MSNSKTLVEKIDSFDVSVLRVMLYSIDEDQLSKLVEIGEDFIKAKEAANRKE